jgi:putative PIN family toxin of toxin-antitoxin system
MRAVLDSTVLVAALRSDQGASRQLVVAALDRKFTLLLSVPLIIEYESVLTRQEHLDAAGLGAAQVAVILDSLVAVAEPVRFSFLWRPTLPDPADDMVLETAVNGMADMLVTFDQKHFADATRGFRLRIVKPGDALEELRGKR